MEKNNIDFTHWFFDLDNTLYCANTGIFDQIHKKMGEFISKNLKVSLKEAKLLQKKYFIEINQKKRVKYLEDQFLLLKTLKKEKSLQLKM